MTRNRPSVPSMQQESCNVTAISTTAKANETHAAIQECFKDLKLCNLSFPIDLPDADASLYASRGTTFDPTTMAVALLQKCTPQAVKSYLKSYPRGVVTDKMDSVVKERSLLTYAVHSNSTEVVELLLEYGASVESSDFDFGRVPLLARAIMQTKWTVRNSTEVVKVLLAHGADPNVVPNDMWKDYIKQPLALCDSSEAEMLEQSSWCEPKHRLVLQETLNLSTCYLLWRGNGMQKIRARKKQVAAKHNIQLLFGLPYMMIGQDHACKLVTDTIFSEIAFPSSKPLVLAFAGPSGYGKTELAKQMGRLLNVPSIEIDCAQTRHEFGLLGSATGYESNKQGSPLNNFLTDNANERCVVFLDEFDKTTSEVREALLEVTDTGMYRDRRADGNTIDTSKCIWIMASNLGDAAIEQFFRHHIDGRKDDEVKAVSVEPLRVKIERVFRESYSPAVTGRIDTVVPFFPFRPNEQAVVAHRFILTFQDEAREPINMKSPPLRLIGHSHVNIVEDGKLCQNLAKTGYAPQQGARSLQNAVGKVRRKFVNKYLDTEAEVSEVLNMGPLQKYTVQLHPIEGARDEVAVLRDGVPGLNGSLEGQLA